MKNLIVVLSGLMLTGGVFNAISCISPALPSSETAVLKNDLSFLTRPSVTEGIYHTVEKGDTLWSIARRHNAEINDLVRANPSIKDFHLLKVGDQVFIPGAQKSTPRLNGENLPAEPNFIWPLKGSILENKGIDGVTIKAYTGQPVYAVKSGMVTFASDKLQGYGKSVVIKHSDGFLSFYAYNSELLVKEDESVKQGQEIARVGQTGRTTQSWVFFRLF
ncbi:MAG: LysM peptidoglycan-binding domain-containing M23 family metallopeptidase [Planctomycetota bacterium]